MHASWWTGRDLNPRPHLAARAFTPLRFVQARYIPTHPPDFFLDAIRNQLATPPVHRRIKSLHARARIGSGKLLSMLLFQSVTKVR